MNARSIFAQAKLIPSVSLGASNQYNQMHDVLRAQVDMELIADPKTLDNIDYKSLELMYDYHRYHLKSMSNAFHFNNYDLLTRILIWDYRSYHAHGFSYDYFKSAFSAWQHAVSANLDPKYAQEINVIYQYFLENHESFVAIAEDSGYETFSTPELIGIQKSFVELLVEGNYHSCIDLAKYFVKQHNDFEVFYSDVLHVCLYEIGRRWEMGTISVAHEHMAIAIVNRIMTSCFLDLELPLPNKGRAVITAAPNDFHEVGARMVSDMLEINGWEVDYLGANTPHQELMQLLRQRKPYILGMSVVMPFNLSEVEAIIHDVRSDTELKNIKIIVGGLAFKHTPDLWMKIGADGYACNLADLISLTDDWWKAS